MENRSLAEVDHPETRARLEGIQGVVYDIGNQVIEYRDKIKAHKAALGQVGVVAETLFQQCVPINKLVDDGKMEPAEAKLRIDQIKRDVEMVREIEARLSEDVKRFKGALMGFDEAIKVSSARFEAEVAKYDRHKRIEAEDEPEGVDELGRTVEERHQKATERANPIAEPTEPGKSTESAPEAKRPLKKKPGRKAG